MSFSLEARVSIIEEIAEDPTARPADRLRALDLLAKYGLGIAHEVAGPDSGPIGIEAVPGAAREKLRERIEGLSAGISTPAK
jgi:hypothetical protein